MRTQVESKKNYTAGCTRDYSQLYLLRLKTRKLGNIGLYLFVPLKNCFVRPLEVYFRRKFKSGHIPVKVVRPIAAHTIRETALRHKF